MGAQGGLRIRRRACRAPPEGILRAGTVTRIPSGAEHLSITGRAEPAAGGEGAFDKEVYRDRNLVELCFARLKQFRAIATRFDKLADRYRAGVILASLTLWLREPIRDHLSDTAQVLSSNVTPTSGVRQG
ncbi:transposase [Streptomyces sp. NPDC046324]|uniref:transposase n=1 Tax=Streptomyces sp. NPDC046324 TaxID=3154915 RepID=UPI0033C85957